MVDVRQLISDMAAEVIGDVSMYSTPVTAIAAFGLGQVTDDRVLCYAILAGEGGSLYMPETADALKAVAFRIVQVGPEVDTDWCDRNGIKPGRDCIHISAAADALDFTDHSNRWVYVRAKHIVHTWDPREFSRVADRAGEIAEEQRRVANGL